MNAADRLARVRRALLLLATALFAGTMVELAAVKHYQDLIQLVPFALCGLGILAVAVVATRPERVALNIIRAFMLVMVGGSALGIWEHIAGNYGFAHELHPRAGFAELARAALEGHNPLIAPGMLAFGAALVVVATFATAHAPAGAPVRRGSRVTAPVPDRAG